MLTTAFSLVALLVAACAIVAAASRHKKSATKPLEFIGRVARVERDLDPQGAVLVCGELMPARARKAETVARAGARVRVVGARGHYLEVEPEA